MTSKKKVYNSIGLSNLHKKKLYYTTVLNVLVLPMFININFQLPNTKKREEICKKISTRLNFLHGRKKSRTRKYFSSFSSFILLKSILLSSFSRKIFENRHFSSFSSKSGHPAHNEVGSLSLVH